MQRIIGLTGGIGSGKSTIAKALVQRGYTVYDCDQEAKRIIAEDKDVQQAIVDLLGQEAFVEGKYNTVYVAKRVFVEPQLLKQLNAIVHPAVGKDILAKHPDFVESAILYESGLDRLCDKIVVVDAPENIRIARTIARDYEGQATEANIQKVRARMKTQRIPRGDLVLVNDGTHFIDELVEKLVRWMCKN